MNTIILDDPIYYIPYISKVPSTFNIADQFPMDTRRKIHMADIEKNIPN